MDREELIDFLKNNLRIEVEEKSGYDYYDGEKKYCIIKLCLVTGKHRYHESTEVISESYLDL